MITCGTDIIEIIRVKDLVEGCNEKSLRRIYTENEISYCESKGKMKFQNYAARFAAKEAVYKAVSCRLRLRDELSWNDVEIVNEESGRPVVRFVRDVPAGVESIDISMSHCKEYATATVIISWKGE